MSLTQTTRISLCILKNERWSPPFFMPKILPVNKVWHGTTSKNLLKSGAKKEPRFPPQERPSGLSENSSSFGYFLEPKNTSVFATKGASCFWGGSPVAITFNPHVKNIIYMFSRSCCSPPPTKFAEDSTWPVCFSPSKRILNAFDVLICSPLTSPKSWVFGETWYLKVRIHQNTS